MASLTSDVVISAFTEEQVERLTSLSKSQLRYWDRIGFFKPHLGSAEGRSPYSRIYSFKDVVGLRTIALLKGKHGVSTQELQKVASRLSQYSSTPWSDITLYVWNRKVQFDEPETGKTRGVVDGQFVLFKLQSVVEDLRREADALRKRRDEQIGSTEKHRYVAHNALVVAGTRIPVATIARFLEDGFSTEEILREYPTLTAADVEAVQRNAQAGAAA